MCSPLKVCFVEWWEAPSKHLLALSMSCEVELLSEFATWPLPFFPPKKYVCEKVLPISDFFIEV